MANTYTQIYIQAVFAVNNCHSIIHKEWRPNLYQYMTDVVQYHGHKVLSIGGVEDHIHLFFGFRPMESLADLIRDVKASSSLWVNQKKLTDELFSWQEGYGAFSYGMDQVSDVCQSISRQEEHHRNMTFMEEYLELLNEFGIDYCC